MNLEILLSRSTLVQEVIYNVVVVLTGGVYDFQATDRIKGVFSSCSGYNWKLQPLT
jgi:hypothetical protein